MIKHTGIYTYHKKCNPINAEVPIAFAPINALDFNAPDKRSPIKITSIANTNAISFGIPMISFSDILFTQFIFAFAFEPVETGAKGVALSAKKSSINSICGE